MSDTNTIKLKGLVSYQELQSARQWIWGWIVFLSLFLLVWLWPALTMNPLQHSFLLSHPSPGTLVSDWWTWDHIITFFLLLLWTVPLSLAFASDSPLTTWRRTFHLIWTFFLFLIMLAILGWWTVEYEAANDPTAANAYNSANDLRWCCLNFILDPARCVPVNAGNLCSSSPGQADLIVPPMFVYRFWFLVVWLLLMVLDFFVIVKGVLERAVARYYRDVIGDFGNSNEEEEEEEEAPAAPAGVYRFRIPVPSAPPSKQQEEEGNPPAYNAKGEPYCPRPLPGGASIGMREQLRAASSRQQHLLVQQAKGASGVGRYTGKNSKR